MKDVALLLNAMVEAGVIVDYALFGALAQMRYTEAVATLDADVLVGVADESRLDVLGPLYAFCRERGHHPEGEAIRVGTWPLQFVPVFSQLTRHALETAEKADFEGVGLRVVRADFLALIALSVGRAKDRLRLLALLESGAVTRDEVSTLAAAEGLGGAWAAFARRFLDGEL